MNSPDSPRARAEAALDTLQREAWEEGYRAGLAIAERIRAWLTQQPDTERQRETRRWADAALTEARGRVDGIRSAAPFLDRPAVEALVSLRVRSWRILHDELPHALWGKDGGARDVTVRELCACSEQTLLRLPGCGRVTIRDIQQELNSYGLSLAPGVEP